MNDVKLIYLFYLSIFSSFIIAVVYIDVRGVDYSYYMIMKFCWVVFACCIVIKKIIGEVYRFDLFFSLIGGCLFSITMMYVFDTLRT